MKLDVVAQGPVEDLEGDFQSALELFDAILRWGSFDSWRGYVKPSGSNNWLMVRHDSEYGYEHQPCQPIRFDRNHKHDLEYVEMKVVELWEYATRMGVTS